MDKIPIFLSNFLSSIIFVSSTIFGLRFRSILLINTVAFMGYLIFVNIQDLSYQSIAITQIPQLSTFYFVCLISSYGLEVHKMNLVKNEQLLKEQITKVEEINLVKDRLFRTLSHDIRGPINSLKGVTSLFKQKYFREQELISLVGALDAAVAKTSNLIDNLLAWSKSQIEDYKSLKLNLKLSP